MTSDDGAFAGAFDALPAFGPCPMLEAAPVAAPSRGAMCCLNVLLERHRCRELTWTDQAADGGRGLPQGCIAHPQDDHADRQESDPRISAGYPGARGQVRRRAGVALRPRALHLPRTCGALQPLRALGIGAGPAQGRHGLPADAGAAGIPGDLGRHHARRRRGCAPQHPPDRDGAGPLHQRRHPEAHHRRRGIARIAGERARPYRRRREDLAPRRCRRQFSPASIARSTAFPATTSRPPIFRPDHRGPRALHLHIGHDRPAEGRQHESLSA